MEFADRWSCVAESFERREIEFDEIVNKDPMVQKCYQCIADLSGCIRNALVNGNASAEDIEALDELDDSIYSLAAEITKCLANKAQAEMHIAFSVGQKYSQLLQSMESRRSE